MFPFQSLLPFIRKALFLLARDVEVLGTKRIASHCFSKDLKWLQHQVPFFGLGRLGWISEVRISPE